MSITLSPLDILNGWLAIIFVIISVTIGLIITSKYFKYKQRDFLFIGLSWTLLCSQWLSVSISFILVLLGENPLPDPIYMSIGNLLWPFGILFWVIAISDMSFQNQKKIIVGIYAVITAVFISYFLFLLFTDYTQIGTKLSLFDVTYVGFVRIYLVFGMFSVLITGFIFCVRVHKSEDPVVRMKAILIIIGLIFYLIGGFTDAALELTAFTLILVRSLLIASSIIFYFGYVI